MNELPTIRFATSDEHMAALSGEQMGVMQVADSTAARRQALESNIRDLQDLLAYSKSPSAISINISDGNTSSQGGIRTMAPLPDGGGLQAIEFTPIAPLPPLDFSVLDALSPLPSLDIPSPTGVGLGTFLGAQAATNALYTRSPAVGPYGQLAGTVDGYQAHHLNQNAVYKSSIAPANGLSILLRGNAFVDQGSPHYQVGPEQLNSCNAHSLISS